MLRVAAIFSLRGTKLPEIPATGNSPQAIASTRPSRLMPLKPPLPAPLRELSSGTPRAFRALRSIRDDAAAARLRFAA